MLALGKSPERESDYSSFDHSTSLGWCASAAPVVPSPVFLHLPTIRETRRQTVRKFWPAFRADYPRILGGMLDAFVGGLRELPSVI